MSQNTVFSRFNTTDYTNQTILTSYSLSITPFTFKPVLDDVSNIYSNRKIYWDFGDGTFSESVTASHYYKLPGVYNVTCFLYDKNGEAYRNSFIQTVTVYDLITDIIKIVLPISNTINYSSHVSNPLTVYRFNSWQNYDIITSAGYTINLYASGSNSPFITSENYNKDKFAHLKPYSKFIIKEFNNHTQSLEDIVVDSINTSNEEIYFNVQNNTLVRCLPTDTNACFVGTSGLKDVYFVDDLGVNTVLYVSGSNTCLTTFNDIPTNIFAYFNYNKLDYDSKDIPKSEYKIINAVSNNIEYTFYNQLSSSQLVITSNGLDGDGETYDTFNIDQNKFQSQKISFVIRAKDSDNYPSKFINTLTLISSDQELTPNTIKIQTMSGNNTVLPITAISNFGVLSSQTNGGYFRGYIEPSISCENVYLSAIANLAFYNSNPNSPLVIAHPQSKYIHSINLNNYNQPITNTLNLTGVSTISLITESTIKDGVCSTYSMWAGDADVDYIKKFNSNGEILSTFNLSAIATTTNSNVSLLGNLSSAAPSNIAFDSNKNAWITLFDAVSTIRINNTTGLVDRVLYPNLTNTDNSLSADYARLSGFGGGNSLSPSSVDVDKSNNVWVSYANPLSSYIIKYNDSGNVTLQISLTAGYSADQLIVDKDDNVWAVYKDYLTKTTELTGYKDCLLYLSAADTKITKIVPLVGSIGDITLDLDQLPIVTFNKNSLVRINNKTTFDTTTYTISSSPFNLSKNISDLNGIAITSDNKLFVISDPSKCIFNIDLDIAIPSPVTSVYVYLSSNEIAPPVTQDSVYSYGDWTGLRWNNKYSSATIKQLLFFTETISCTSNNFNIYPTTGKYEIGKINENMDFTELYKANTFQESLMLKPALYDNFLGTIVGNISSNQNTIGKRVYEKISNFTDNVYNVDTCNISSLLSLQTLLNEPSIQFTKYSYIFPANINRIMDLASVKITRMWGETNKFNYNYNKYGLTDSDIHGINLGSELNFFTTTLTAGSASLPIVAYEKFSKNYYYINTDILSASYVNINATNNTYKLSAYDDRWGWGLVLPNNYVSTDISNYYTFYNYISTFENTYTGGLINWGDNNTTIDKTQRSITYVDSVFNNMLTYQFAKGLNLLTSDDNIDA